MESSFEESVQSLLRVCNRILKNTKNEKLFDQLGEAVANVEAWEQNDDPIKNGWVGSDGLP